MVIKTVTLAKSQTPMWYIPITPKLLREITRRIVAEFQPERIVLFGSYAYGKPTVHSDVDLLVITNRMQNKSAVERDRLVAMVARTAIPAGKAVGMDILVRSPAEFNYRLRIGDPFFRTIALQGKTLYCRPHSRYRLDANKWRNQMPKPVLIQEWIQKAEDDYLSAIHLLRLRKHPQPAAVCYHCQQCVEKYLKAFLLKNNILFEKTHDLIELNRSCVSVDASFVFLDDWLKLINPYAIETRYPGRVFEVTEARQAIATMKAIRKFVRAKLGLDR